MKSRGVPPNGGWRSCFVRSCCAGSNGSHLIDEGLIKRIRVRGVTFSTRVTVQFENVHAAHEPEETSEFTDDKEKDLLPPADVGEQIASVLLEEIERGGVVDSTHQGLLFLLCALCPQDVSKVRVGKLSRMASKRSEIQGIFFYVKFVIKPDPNKGTVILKCIGSGMKNLSRKIS